MRKTILIIENLTFFDHYCRDSRLSSRYAARVEKRGGKENSISIRKKKKRREKKERKKSRSVSLIARFSRSFYDIIRDVYFGGFVLKYPPGLGKKGDELWRG